MNSNTPSETEARKITVMELPSTPRKRLLAWSILKTARGQRTNQIRLRAMIRQAEGWGISRPPAAAMGQAQ